MLKFSRLTACIAAPVFRFGLWIFLASLVAGVTFDSVAVAQSDASPKSAKRIRALMVTGGCCHDYENQKQIISEGLSKRVGPIDWTIIDEGDKRDTMTTAYQTEDWIKGFDIVVHNECYGGVLDGEFVQRIVDGHVDHQVPALVVHCSMHSYRAAPTADSWRAMLGVTSRRHEKKKRSLTVVPTAEGKSSPLVAALGESWKTPNGELYIIENVWPGATVLATAASDETGNREPVVWTNQYRGVRVFATTLGHHNETIQHEVWQAMVAEGWKWALQK